MSQVTGKFIDSNSLKTESASGDDSTTAFVLTFTPINGTHLDVSLDGLEQLVGTDYTVNTGTKTITFTTAPASGQDVLFKYIAKV